MLSVRLSGTQLAYHIRAVRLFLSLITDMVLFMIADPLLLLPAHEQLC